MNQLQLCKLKERKHVPLSFIHKLFVLKNLNVFIDLKSSTWYFGT